ncbi:putative inositol 1,3,4-triphosphate 5/6 kinase [Danaus plexippus plexippus]|uniref:Inositol-tetrakisphosphate 1-kinase n=1 Tax=Danaus plexippus plexippus TaxID=278856 RepID=A0A212F8P9_DANPL|nr:putative inositol 1,3,4-triphosphate 5/6 kinase [Danaus plexippus plexippus]
MGDSSSTGKNIGIWISDKKSHKLNWKELIKTCNAHGYNIVKLDLDIPFEDQGRMDIFLHKLTDVIAAADQGDVKASIIIGRVEQYLSNHPHITVIDPLNNVRLLLNRYCYYTILQDELSFQNHGIFTPAFAEFKTSDIEQNVEIMRSRGVKFPVICKPTVAHGSKLAHEMVLIFNERGLNVCKAPCVVQNFVNHNAVLHKVFVIGNKYHISERPSLKNFNASENLDPIYYSTGEVCKADSNSTLSILDPHDKSDIRMTLDEDKIRTIIRILRRKIGLVLVGFDVVIDNVSGNHAVIDINVFPSYDSFPNFFELLIESIEDTVSRSGNMDISDDIVEDHTLNGLVNIGDSHASYSVIGMNIN